MITEDTKKWVAALRSGDYKQGKEALKKKDAYGEGHYCCLGVACEIMGLEQKEGTTGLVVFENTTTYWMPLFWAEKLGFNTEHGLIKEENRHTVDVFLRSKGYELDNIRSLAQLNDWGVSFDVIADIIEMDVLV